MDALGQRERKTFGIESIVRAKNRPWKINLRTVFSPHVLTEVLSFAPFPPSSLSFFYSSSLLSSITIASFCLGAESVISDKMKSWEPLTIQPVYCYTEGHEASPGTKPLRRETVGLGTIALTVPLPRHPPAVYYESYDRRSVVPFPQLHNCPIESIFYTFL